MEFNTETNETNETQVTEKTKVTKTLENYSIEELVGSVVVTESPKSSFTVADDVQTITAKTTSINNVSKIDDIAAQDPLEKIKKVAIALHHEEHDAEVSEVTFIKDSFSAITNPMCDRSAEFSVGPKEGDATSSLSSYGRPKEPGSLGSQEFVLDTSNTTATGNSFTQQHLHNMDTVKATSYGTLAAQVNFDMLGELKESIWDAKESLAKVTQVKEQELLSVEQSLAKTEDLLQKECNSITNEILAETLQFMCEVKVEEMSPEDRTTFWSAQSNLKQAAALVNKAGFKESSGQNETLVKDLVQKAIKLYPTLTQEVRFKTLLDRIILA